MLKEKEVGSLNRPDGAMPLYLQIKNQLRQEIEAGHYAAGDKLPSERELCETFSVSRIPVRKALEQLEAEGLIQSFQGKGSFVKTPLMQNNLVHISTFSQNLAQQGYEGHTVIVSFEAHNPDPAGDGMLDAARNGTSRMTLLGYANGEPVVFYDSVLRRPMAQRFYDTAREAEAAGEAFSTFDLYGRNLISIGKMEQRVMAANADARVSGHLQIPEGTAVLVLETVIRNSNLEPVEYKRGYYRTDKYSFTLHRSL